MLQALPGPGAPWRGMQGATPFARRRPGSSETIERCTSPAAATVSHALTNPRGCAERAVSLNVGPTKGRLSFADGSSWKCLPAAGGHGPLDPCRLPWHVGFELWTLCRQGRGSSQRSKLHFPTTIQQSFIHTRSPGSVLPAPACSEISGPHSQQVSAAALDPCPPGARRRSTITSSSAGHAAEGRPYRKSGKRAAVNAAHAST